LSMAKTRLSNNFLLAACLVLGTYWKASAPAQAQVNYGAQISTSVESQSEIVQPQPSPLPDCAGSREEQIECWFQRGLDYQQQAEREGKGGERERLLEAAKDAYLQAYKIDNGRGGVLNNLAVVLSLLGGTNNDEEARKLFEKAVGLDHRLRPFFRRNYADFLRSRGKFEEAVHLYRETLDEEPDDYQAYQSLKDIFKNNPDVRQRLLPEILWFLADKGQLTWTEETSLQELQSPGRPPEWRREMLAILAFALGKDAYLPSELAESPSGKTLRMLTDDPDVGPGAREILQLHAGERLDPDQYSWWSAQPRENTLAPGRPAPLAAFQNLIRGLGSSSEKTGSSDQAERYFKLSALLDPETPDVVASDRLANLAVKSGRTADLELVVARNEPLLNRPDARGGLEVYRYRQHVGLLFGTHGRWGNENTPVSAIYQLARAKELTEKILIPNAPGSPVNDFDVRVYTHLAAGYGAISQPEKGGHTLRELVRAFEAQGLKKEAAALQAVLNGRQTRGNLPNRRPKVLDDPPFRLQDFTTGPPQGPPQ
jgi:tetratricopeptide (TPR) repeat protein